MDRGPDTHPHKRLPETIGEAAVVLDPATGRILLANRAAAEMFHYGSPEEMLGVNPLDHILDEHRGSVAPLLALALQEERPVPAEISMTTTDGKPMCVSVTSALIEHEGRKASLATMREITSEKDKDAALRAADEARLRLMEALSEGVVIIQDGKFVYINPAVAERAGIPQQQMLGLSPLHFIDPADRAARMKQYERVMAGDWSAGATTVKGFGPGGQPLWAEIRDIPFTWQGRPAIMSLVRDITDKMRAQEALRSSEERFRTLIERATDVVIVLDPTGNITYHSPSLERVTGYGPNEWVGRPLGEWRIHPDDEAALAGLLQQVLTQPGATIEGVTVRYQHRDGSWHTLEATVTNMLLDPKVNGLVANFRDVTERRRAEEALIESEGRFRAMVETTSDWVWETDRDTRYTYVSPKVRDILGYEPGDLLGHTPFEFMHPKEGRRVTRIVRHHHDTHQPLSLMENTCTHRDGRSVVLETSAVPVFDNDGHLSGYRGINRDITERKKVEQELQRSLKRLERTMDSTIEAITTAIETRDPYTAGHQTRVTDLACAIAKVMALPASQIEGIRVAGLMHDIGKIAIPTEILAKPGKLNEVEYVMVKTHSSIGHNILKKIEFHWPVATAVLQHHERWNGSGYPHGIRGEDICLEARILAVADVVEAMSSHRPYRPSVGAGKAMEEIARNSGVLYDPAVARACVTVFNEKGFKFAEPGLEDRLEAR